MTSQNNQTETPENTDAENPGNAETEPKVFDADYVKELREESARHRVAAKESTERADALLARVRDLAIRDAARDILADPTDLPWSDEMAGEDGLPDPARITEAAEALVSAKPHMGRARGDIGQGYKGEPRGMSLAEAMRLTV